MTMKRPKSLPSIQKWGNGFWHALQRAFSAEKINWKSSCVQSPAKGVCSTKRRRRHVESNGIAETARSSSGRTRVDSSSHPFPPNGSEQESGTSKRPPSPTTRPALSPKQQSLIHSPSGSQDLGTKAPRSFVINPSEVQPHVEAFHAGATGSKPFVPRSSSGRKTNKIQKLIEKRMSTLDIQVRVQESRNALRNKRETLMARDARFSEDLRKLVARSSNAELQALVNLHEDIQDCREEVQLQELDYAVLEDQLIRNEWELKEDETKVYRELEMAQQASLVEDVVSLSNSEAAHSASSIGTVSAPSIVQPLRQQFLARVEDRDRVMERLQELRTQRARWVEQEIVCHRVSLGLDKEAQSFLDGFDARQKALEQDLVQIKADLSNLKKGISQQADILYYSSREFEREVESADELSSGSILDSIDSDDADFATKDPLFLVNEKDPDLVFRNVSTEASQESISTVSYINEWLLHMLRRSAIEVRRFKMTDKLRTLHLPPENLKQLVLEWWSKDETVSVFFNARNNSVKSVSASFRAMEQDFHSRVRGSDSVVSSIDAASVA